MQLSEVPPQQPPEEAPAQPIAPQGTPSQPLRPPRPYATRPRPSQPLPPLGQWDGPTQPLRLPRLTPKRRTQLLWMLGGVIAIVLIGSIVGIVAVAAGSKDASSNTASNSTALSTAAPTTTSTQQPVAEHHQVGDTITTALWQVTINSARAYDGNPYQFEVPAAGDTFLVLEGTFKNLTDTAQPLSTLQFFALQDTQGNTYLEAVLNSVPAPDDTVLASGRTQGEWGYEVPTSIHSFVLIFSDDVGQTTSVWDISI